jgi:hypothetical protein
MAEQSGPDTEGVGSGAGDVKEEGVQPAKRVIWTPERLAKAAATRAETKRKKEERETRKATRSLSPKGNPAEESGDKIDGPRIPIHTSSNGFDWNTAPLAEAINKLSEMKREYDRCAGVVMRRQTVSKPVQTCWTQFHKDIVPKSVQSICRKQIEDGKWAFRDDGVFRTEGGLKIPDPQFCCNHMCFAAYQQAKPMMALSRH